jgi:hypothetical protein
VETLPSRNSGSKNSSPSAGSPPSCAMLVAIGLVPAALALRQHVPRHQRDHRPPRAPGHRGLPVGRLWKGASYRGALTTMIGGALAGILVFIHQQARWPDARSLLHPRTNFMMMAFYLFAFCSLLLFASSLAMPKSSHEDPEKLYFKSCRTVLASRLARHRQLQVPLLPCFRHHGRALLYIPLKSPTP